MCDLCNYTGNFYYGEGHDGPCFNCKEAKPEADERRISRCFDFLYTTPSKTTRSSYAMKHDVEYLLNQYVSNEELKNALKDSVPYQADEGDINYHFFVKPKFDLHWLRSPPTVRPKGAKKSHWEAYQVARSLQLLVVGLSAGSPSSTPQHTPLSSPVHSPLQDEQHPCNP